jgi:chemotaxis family two-component system response regulator Rcp1
VLKEVKQDDKLKLIPIIVLTTSQDEDDICNSYRCYANAYVTKPADFDEFDELICSFEDFWFNKAMLPQCKMCKKD